MKNLKRIFSLALAGTMLAGMLTVGASAANFTDAEDIKNDDAVNFMVALNIINGKDDGSFDPEATVTRAEMAKMITIALNGGREPVLGTKTTPSYTDIKGNWAEKYIEYCSNLGIIGGRGNGIFDPSGTVTGSEAAKMMLVAMGYDSTVFKFTGADWAINVNTEANNATPNKLYKGIEGIDPNAGLSRDNAAQLIYNGVQDHIMQKSPSLTITNGEITYGYNKMDEPGKEKTILTEKYGYNVKYGYLTGTSFNDDKDEYNYSIANSSVMGPTIATTDGGVTETLKAEADYSALYGQKVKVVYNNDKVAMGIYAASDSKVVAEGAWGKATQASDGKSVKFDGTTYKYESASIPKIDFNTGAAATLKKEFTFKAIDNDDNGKVDVIVVLPITVAKVTFVGKESITTDAPGAYKFSEADIYEDAKKDDYVVIVNKANTANDTTVITKTDVLEGTVAAVRDGDVRVDGTWYKLATTSTGDTAKVGDEVKLAMVNGYIVNTKVTEGSATLSDVVYVIKSAGTTNTESDKGLDDKYKGDDTMILFADGTKKTVKAMRVDTASTALKAADNNTTGNDNDKCVVPSAGLYTYTVKNDIYQLKAVKATSSGASVGSFYAFDKANLPGSTTLGNVTGKDESSNTDDSKNAYGSGAKKLDSKFIADDAVIYLVKSGAPADQKVISGKDLKSMKGFGASADYLYKDVSGLSTVQVAVITTANAFGTTDAGTGYGYVVSGGYAEKNSDDELVVKFTVWNGKDEVELTATDAAAGNATTIESKYKSGSFVKYTTTNVAGEVTDVAAIGTQAAITGWDGEKYIKFDGATDKEMKDNDKTVVIFVNTKDGKGVEGGEIVTATVTHQTAGADDAWVKNAVWYDAPTADGELEVLFVDTNNELKGGTYTLTWATDDPAAVAGVDVSGFDVDDKDDTDITTGTAVAAGSTLKVVVAGSGTATADVTITVTMTLINGTTQTGTLKVAKDATFSGGTVTLSMPNQAVASIAVSVAVA